MDKAKLNTNFQMLRALLKGFKPEERGILSAKEHKEILDALHINEMDILQLRNLRDFTVLFLSTKMEDKNEKIPALDTMDICSAITAVIDDRIFDLGGEI